jgi:Flp pilus assembly protein TadG
MQKRNNIFYRLLKNQLGLAAVEFALALPMMIILTFGSIEVTLYVLVTQKVERVAVNLSDIVAQSTTVSTAQLNEIIKAAGQVMLPYNFSTDGYAIISSVSKTGTNAPVVKWQYKSSGIAQASKVGVVNGNATLPSGFTMADKDNVIITEVFYNYKPILSGTIYSSSQIYRHSIYKPRLGNLTTLSSIFPFGETRRQLCLS